MEFRRGIAVIQGVEGGTGEGKVQRRGEKGWVFGGYKEPTDGAISRGGSKEIKGGA